ncbi:helix-turn-helix domain-containing GNAT family N-acetyltransferase [Mesorhizobium sp. ASY16-5R]|uniref:helix-turn-helix domain-containing GNAT family N-acetyltransferase n=1 Tax=Mesorhizobium sp. ASY16-5R TaxID=3445772 RepID=UPI003FA10365
MTETKDRSRVERVRDSSRRIVRELGFMKPTVGATGLPISAVHALIEIGGLESLTPAGLGEILNLEKSSVSRMLRKLVVSGEIEERENPGDARSKLLSLTAHGRDMLQRIDGFGRSQVEGAFDHLSPEGQGVVVAGLDAYAEALRTARLGRQGEAAPPDVEIVAGYVPGVIGRVAEMHGRYYAKPYGFGRFFEAKVAGGMAEFSGRLDRPMNGLWAAMRGGEIVGTVAVDGEDFGPGIGHLRWFIMDDAARGLGIGRRLLAEAIGFCDRRQFGHVDLWTLRGLDAARKLYEDFGFALVEELVGDQWGKQVTEQRFRRVGR